MNFLKICKIDGHIQSALESGSRPSYVNKINIVYELRIK